MRQILLFAALAASLALLSGCTLSKTKKDTEDMTGKAAYHKLSAEEAYEMMASQEVVVVDVRTREMDPVHIFPINRDKENAVISRLFSMFSINLVQAKSSKNKGF